jgi:hypothetical protein
MNRDTPEEFQQLAPQVRERLCIPPDGAWFYRQQPVLDRVKLQTDSSAILKNNTPGFPVAWDNGKGGKVYGFYPSAEEFYECLLKTPAGKRNAYELIRENTPCKGYLDVEWIGKPDEGHTKLKMITHSLRTKLKSAANITADLYVACGTRNTADPDLLKHSYHIVVDNAIFDCNHDGTMKNFFSLDTTDDWYYTAKDGKQKYIVDLGVYTRNRLFRLPLCCKADDPQKTPLVRISGDPFNDDFTHSFPIDSARDVMPMVLSNAEETGRRKFVRPIKEDSHQPVTDTGNSQNARKKRARPAEEDTPATDAGNANNAKSNSKPKTQRGCQTCCQRDPVVSNIVYKSDAPFSVPDLESLLRGLGDTVSRVSKISQTEDDKEIGRWRVQCDQRKQNRTCITNPTRTHASNNCILTVERHDDTKFRVTYHCMGTECKKYAPSFIGYCSSLIQDDDDDSNVSASGEQADANVSADADLADTNASTDADHANINVSSASAQADTNVSTAANQADPNVSSSANQADPNVSSASAQTDANVSAGAANRNQNQNHGLLEPPPATLVSEDRPVVKPAASYNQPAAEINPSPDDSDPAKTHQRFRTAVFKRKPHLSYCERECLDLPEKYRVIGLGSPCGTGKSKAFYRLVRKLEAKYADDPLYFVYVTHRKALTSKAMTSLPEVNGRKWVSYDEVDGAICIEKTQLLIVQYESLGRVCDLCYENLGKIVLVLDEVN